MTDEDKVLIEFAEKIGKLTQGLKGLQTDFGKHLKEHTTDRIMQWVIIGLQTLVLLALSWLRFMGKIG